MVYPKNEALATNFLIKKPHLKANHINRFNILNKDINAGRCQLPYAASIQSVEGCSSSLDLYSVVNKSFID